MNELIKADLKRVLKDKLMRVLIILAVVFAVITPISSAIILSVVDVSSDPMIAALLSAKGLFFQSFSMTNNLGFIAPILLAIVLCKDFSYGTVRNKIIAGKKRSSIFLSMFIVCALVLTSVIMLSALLSLGTSLIFFDYQDTPFTLADFGYFMASLGLELLVLLFMSALLSLLCACSKNVGIAIVLYVAVTFVLMIFGTVTQLGSMLLEGVEGGKLIADIMKVLDRINMAMATSYIGSGSSYTLSDVLYLTLSPIISVSAFITLGIFAFNKKELK